MRKHFVKSLMILGTAIAMALTAYGSGAEASRNYKNQGFTALEVASGLRLEAKQGENYEVVVSANDNHALQLIRVEQFGKALRFYLPPFSLITTPIRIYVTMPALTRLDLSGGSKADLTMDVVSEIFAAGLSGGSELTGSLKAKQLEIALSGGSRSNLAGEADTMELEASGGSQIHHEDFPVNKADLRLSGGSRAYVFVKEMIQVDASGGSQVYYRGIPRIGKTSFSGGAGIRSLE